MFNSSSIGVIKCSKASTFMMMLLLLSRDLSIVSCFAGMEIPEINVPLGKSGGIFASTLTDDSAAKEKKTYLDLSIRWFRKIIFLLIYHLVVYRVTVR